MVVNVLKWLLYSTKRPYYLSDCPALGEGGATPDEIRRLPDQSEGQGG